MIKEENDFSDGDRFRQLLSGLLAVPRDELDAEMRKEVKQKAKAEKPKAKK